MELFGSIPLTESKVSSKVDSDVAGTQGLTIGAAELFAAVSYMTDVFPAGCHFHSWRVALVAERIASLVAPEQRREVFFAGLLQDIGAVGAHKHITKYNAIEEQVRDAHIATHSERAAALLGWLPGMAGAAELVQYHHEHWDGTGYPHARSGDGIPVGSQILRIADALDCSGAFAYDATFTEVLKNLAVHTGRVWSKDMWAALIKSLEDGPFYRSIMNSTGLHALMTSKLRELGVPSDLNDEAGVERVLHLFAALVDIKDPSTSGHSRKTAGYAAALAEHMGLSEEDVHTAYHAGLVHDCGRLGLPSEVISRSGRLNDRELSLVRQHAKMTIRTLSCLPEYPDMARLGEIAGHDHERYDGNGYPDRLAADQIHLISRILCAVDAFDAMTSASNYRLLSPRCAVIRLQQGAGAQFDPEVVKAIVSAVSSGVFGEKFGAAA